jgi:hypothetical protein
VDAPPEPHCNVVICRTVAHEAAQLAVDPVLDIDIDCSGNMAAESEFLVFRDELDARASLAQGAHGFFLAVAKAGNNTDTGYNDTTHDRLPRNLLLR